MAERYRDEIIEEIPEVDAVLGTNSYDKILDAIQEELQQKGFLAKLQDYEPVDFWGGQE